MFKNRSIAFRFTTLIISSVVLIIGVIVYINYMFSSKIVHKNVEDIAHYLANSIAGDVETTMTKITTSTERMAMAVESGNMNEKSLKEFNKNIVERCNETFGAAIAFEPYSVDSSRKYFSTYFYENAGEVIEGDLNVPSYDYLNWDWYTKPKEKGVPMWIGPYLDEGGGNVFMATYTYPFYRYINGKKVFWGVATHDINLKWIKDYFSSFKVYQSDYAFLLTEKGDIIAHPNTEKTKDKTIFELAKEVNDTTLNNVGIKMTNGETGYMPYYSRVQKIDGYLLFKPLKSMGWSFGMFFPKDEIMADIRSLNRIEIALGIAGALILAIFIIYISNSLSRAVKIATDAAEAIAEGNIANAELISENYLKKSKLAYIDKKKVKSEPLRLFFAFRKMSKNLYSLISQVQQSAVSVSSSATEIAASAHELEATVAEQAASTREVSATTKQIASSSKEFTGRIHTVDETLGSAVDMADSGRQGLDNLSEVMQRLISASSSISSKLSIINNNANKISVVITTIDKISDQTNMLSLNAAIEAEKAGDYGKGFAVVAREISRLSDQTSIAAADIENMVKEMQSSVSYGVMEMDKFGNEVRNGSEEANAINMQLSEIIALVKQLKPEFELVEFGMVSQSEGAEQINESMIQLTEAAEQTKDALSEFKNVTNQLNDAVFNLKMEVSKFNLRKKS